ncbi:MAG: hypothetical protein LKF01_01115 [Lactobacillus sp.]|jgi:hypothetical protein|nr:hypothetical protein [Lactobacillus sp.]MCH4068139.1 hypothetical protein [Lactobacillus sp.]MCI1304320.1 hypothetical protein [Lactobacillus sp.]MCI1330069.1 hypothetical protein [Lactobacillus sp.]MCI1359840.1 hypothetical protein [Lactobacillus sp.]
MSEEIEKTAALAKKRGRILEPNDEKHSNRYWRTHDFPTHEQFIRGLKEAGLYKKPDAAAIKRRKRLEKWVEENEKKNQ